MTHELRNRARAEAAGGDRDAAARTLADWAQQLLADPATTCFIWRLHAAAWAELGDRETARDYLAHAHATTGEELCDLAGGYRALGDLDTATALVARAEALGAWAHVAFACAYELGDHDRAEAAIARGLREATTVDDAIAMVKRRSYEDEDDDDDNGELRRHLGWIGSTLARTAGDWLAIAGVYHSHTIDQTGGDAYLDRAMELAGDAATRHHIAYRRERWGSHGDDAGSPPMLLPAEILRGNGRCAPGWRRDPAALFELLRVRIDRAQLADIAENDYGFDEAADACLAAMWQSGSVQHPLYDPREELELERWHAGPSVDHVSRAFACALLCIDAAGPDSGDNIGGTLESAIPVLLESCIELGPDAVEGALGLLLAMSDAVPSTISEVADTYAVLFIELGVVLAAAWRDAGDPRLVPLIARLIADEAQYRASARAQNAHWLLGLTVFNQRHEVWRKLAKEILVHPDQRELRALMRVDRES